MSCDACSEEPLDFVRSCFSPQRWRTNAHLRSSLCKMHTMQTQAGCLLSRFRVWAFLLDDGILVYLRVIHTIIRLVVASNYPNDHRRGLRNRCIILSTLSHHPHKRHLRNVRLRSWEPLPRRLVGLLLMLYSRRIELA